MRQQNPQASLLVFLSFLIFQVLLLTFRHRKGLALKRVTVLPKACRRRDSRDEARGRILD
jgi:hypothetical protein